MKKRAEILKMVEEENVEFIRLQFTDMFGVLKNIAVTAGQLEKVLDNSYFFDGSCMYAGLKSAEEDMLLIPDLNTYTILPWRPQQGKVARLLCDVCRSDGSALEEDPRQILKEVLKETEKRGYEFFIDPECEFFLFHTDENGIPSTLTHEQAGYMDISPLDLGENARRDMVLMLEDMGFIIEASHHGKAPAQHEIDFRDTEPLKTADQIMTFKTAVRSIARRFGLHATFMPKPTTQACGSGLHMNLSLIKNGKNLFYDPQGEDGLSKEARWFIGGIMSHVKAMCAVTNPLVNSYKRLAAPEAPGLISWTAAGRNAMIRVPAARGENTRVELRFPDPSANPYLTLALCLSAGMEGIEKKTEPYGKLEKGAGEDGILERLPQTLGEAAELMEKDTFINRVLGNKMVERYTAAKRKEWNDYTAEVSEWEIKQYLYRI